MGNQTANVDPAGNEFGAAWRGFLTSLRQLLSEPQSERALDAFLAFRNATLDALDDPNLVAGLQSAWSGLHNADKSPVAAHLLLTELLAFPAAMEVKENEEKSTKEPRKSLWKRLVGIGGTTMDSARELLDDLPFQYKAVLKVGKEVVDIFRGE